MRPIDADKIMADIASAERSTPKDYTLLSIARYISIQPTIEVEPVKHGHWINDKGLYKCSVCNEFATIAGFANCIPIEQMNKTMKYCNSCGAIMDEVNDGVNR